MIKGKKFKKIKKALERSGLFDVAYYLKNYHDARVASETPIDHFVKYGLEKDYKPNTEFDPVWYREYYVDVKKNGIYPFLHYVLYGRRENRRVNEKENNEYLRYENKFDVEFYRNCYEDLKQQDEAFDYILHYIRYGKKEGRIYKNLVTSCKGNKFGSIQHNPLVSLIAVNYNGSKDLPVFLNSVASQSYRNFELIIVDNDSKDNSEEIVKSCSQKFKNIKFIKTEQNLGFAAGNNYALPYCKGELLCLINVDTKVDKEWLKELVDAMAVDGDCAAVVSKTYFFERFADLHLKCQEDFFLDLDVLIKSLEYKKYFVQVGDIKDNHIYSTNQEIIISLPVQTKPIEIFCSKENDSEINLIYTIGKGSSVAVPFMLGSLKMNLSYSEDTVINSSYIINNAGSFTKDGMPADRGFGEYDVGQYDTKAYVDFACGVSVLLRRSAIINRKIFVSEFFAYYEDSELSRWLTEQGYKILYTPRSKLWHQHSATSSEGSPLWSLLVTRSRNIYQYNGDYVTLFNTNNHFEEHFKPDINKSVYKELKHFSKVLRERLEKENDIVEKLKPIAIYNSYWMTKGGGESHALSFAVELQKYETVYLISEMDFDIDELAEYYHMDLSNCRKIVETNITPEFTEKFDIFINSTYRSNLVSKAKKSYYIVSFPHKDVNREILDCYTFLYNSDYTQKWAKRYWGENLSEEIVYPLGMIDVENVNVDMVSKEKVMLSVGRFFRGEHSKNQHIVAEAYVELVKKYPELGEWKFVLIGSLNENSMEDVSYVKEIQDILLDTNHDLIVNADRKTLNDYFDRASLYIHASGYGNDPEKEPNKFEHFGITPVEAMVRGCYPIVYSVGGPAELLHRLNIGDTFTTKEELASKMKEFCMTGVNNESLVEISDAVKVFIVENSIEDQINNIMHKEGELIT